MTKNKQARNKRPGLFSFVAGWAATYLVALFASFVIYPGDSQFYTLYSKLWPLIFAGIVSISQVFWLRRSWGITLWHWLPLALLGVIAGGFAFHIVEIHVIYPFPPKLYSGSLAVPEPQHIMQLKYTLYQTVRWFLLWSTPLIFQWLALRKRFAGHGLWLVAAVVHAPLNFYLTEHGGIAVNALKFFGQFTENLLIRDAQPLGSIAALLDMATPTMIMGLALYWLLTNGEKMKTAQTRAHQ